MCIIQTLDYHTIAITQVPDKQTFQFQAGYIHISLTVLTLRGHFDSIYKYQVIDIVGHFLYIHEVVYIGDS